MRIAVACIVVLAVLTGCQPQQPPGACDSRSWSTALGAPQLISNSLPSSMGATVSSACATGAVRAPLVVAAADGGTSLDTSVVAGEITEMVVPVLPMFNDTGYAVTPKLLIVAGDGAVRVLHEFVDPPESYRTGFEHFLTLPDGTAGSVPRALIVSTARGANGDTFVSNNVTSEILRFTAAGERSVFATGVLGVSGLAGSSDGTIYAAIPATFSFSSELIDPPMILKFDPLGVRSILHELSRTEFDYSSGFSRSAGEGTNLQVPVGYKMDLALSESGAVYAALSVGGGIVRIAPDGTAEVLARSLGLVSGIALASEDDVYFAEAPINSDTADGTPLRRGVRVSHLVGDAAPAPLYEGPLNEPFYNSGFLRTSGAGLVAVDAVFDLELDASGNVYLQDNLANRFQVLPRG